MEGGKFSFAAAAAGGYGTLLYQWRKNGEIINGANGTEYTLSPLDLGDSGTYSVEVSDTNGDSTESTPVALTVARRVPVVGMGGLALLALVLAAAGRGRRR